MTHANLDNRYMEFRLGDQLFAVPLMAVKEVIQKPEITTIPNMPQHFEGMMNLRGQILGVFNVRKKLGAKTKVSEITTPDVVIVAEQNGLSMGMIVDEVTRVIHADEKSLREAPLKKDDPVSRYIRNVIQADDNMVLTIDIDELLETNKYLSKMAS
jgi:purine-binding chemotaxis protein CheW